MELIIVHILVKIIVKTIHIITKNIFVKHIKSNSYFVSITKLYRKNEVKYKYYSDPDANL